MSVIVHLLQRCFHELVYPALSSLGAFWFRLIVWLWATWEDNASFGFQRPWKPVVATLTLVLCIFLYKLLFTPYNRVKSWPDVGYDYIRSKTGGKKYFLGHLNGLLRRRKIGELPPVFPNGWFALLESQSLNVKQVKDISALGQNFAVYRGEDGKVRILDAYCPHLGANLAVGGNVIGNCLQCPFHGWEFNGRGQCTKIPYAKNIPKTAHTKTWYCCEKNGFIYVWYHSDDEPPTWQIPDAKVLGRGWKYCGRSEHYVNSHIEDIPENAGDVAHLNHVHGPAIFGGADIRYTTYSIWTKVMRHYWTAKWTPNEAPNAHCATMNLNHAMKVFGHVLSPITIDVDIQQIGPAIVHLTVKSMFGKVLLIQTVSPLEPLRQKVYHTCYAQTQIPMFLAKLLMLSESLNFERDVMVWNNKKYISKPILVAEDSLIRKHRRWYSQFYNDSSPTFEFQKDNLSW